MRIFTQAEVHRFNNAVELADLLLGPDYAWASVPELVSALSTRSFHLAANELRTAALAVGELEEPLHAVHLPLST